eukprot:3049468-Rhodomonas_salina.5
MCRAVDGRWYIGAHGCHGHGTAMQKRLGGSRFRLTLRCPDHGRLHRRARPRDRRNTAVSYTHLRAHETEADL